MPAPQPWSKRTEAVGLEWGDGPRTPGVLDGQDHCWASRGVEGAGQLWFCQSAAHVLWSSTGRAEARRLV